MPSRSVSAPPDWDRVQAWALAHVVELAHEYGGVELNKAGRAPCPLHGGEHPNLSVENGKGFHCFTCDEKGDGVALVAALTNRERLDVLRELAPRAGVVLEDRRPGRGLARARVQRTETPPPTPPTPPDPLAPLRADGMVPSLAPAIHRAVWDALTLTARGADYLHGRGLEPGAAGAYGFRSIDGRRTWDDVRALLADSFTPEELAGAGWWAPGDDKRGKAGRVWQPYATHTAPIRPFGAALAIPYWHRGALVALRFRNLDPLAHKNDRYRTGKHVTISEPFNADDLDDSAGGELHIAEGELDAFTLHLYGVRVVGLPGAGAATPWLERLADAGRLVTWYDDDEGGTKGRREFAAALVQCLGRDWLAARGRAVTLHNDDVNGCHQRGTLADILTRAEWRTA